MSLEQINNIQEESFSPLMTPGFISKPDYLPLRSNMRILIAKRKAKTTVSLCVCPTPAGEPPPL
jgi:hypothetical protein